MNPDWQPVLTLVLTVLIGAFLGSPFVNAIKVLFKLEDKQALACVLVVSLFLSVLEACLEGVFRNLTPTEVYQNFPVYWTAIVSGSMVYYRLLKTSDGPFGRGWLLKE